MIQPLFSLSDGDAGAVAVALFGIEPSPANLTNQLQALALSVAATLPPSWQREWSYGVLRRVGLAELNRSVCAHARKAQLRFSAQLYVYSQPRSSSYDQVFALLTSPSEELQITVQGDREMSISNEQTVTELPLQLHVGELCFGIDELLALKRGEKLRCPLPDILRGTLHSFGAPVGSAKISFVDGQIGVEIQQLFAITPDK